MTAVVTSNRSLGCDLKTNLIEMVKALGAVGVVLQGLGSFVTRFSGFSLSFFRFTVWKWHHIGFYRYKIDTLAAWASEDVYSMGKWQVGLSTCPSNVAKAAVRRMSRQSGNPSYGVFWHLLHILYQLYIRESCKVNLFSLFKNISRNIAPTVYVRQFKGKSQPWKAVITCRSVVPNNNNLLWTFKISHLPTKWEHSSTEIWTLNSIECAFMRDANKQRKPPCQIFF